MKQENSVHQKQHLQILKKPDLMENFGRALMNFWKVNTWIFRICGGC